MTPPCLILTAGFGTRMGELTARKPKPLIEVGGRTLLDRALDIARDAQAARIAVNAHYRADQIAAHLPGQPDLTVLHEQPEILDSGGAVKNAARLFGPHPMATLNADNVWRGPNPLTRLSEAFDPARMGALLLLTPRHKAVGRKGVGDFRIAPDGRITLDKSDDSHVFLGAQILDPRHCVGTPRDAFSLHEAWQVFSDQGRLFGLIYDGAWADVGHPEGIMLAEEMLEGADV